MRRLALTIAILFLALSLMAEDEISFSGGTSSLSLQEGRRHVKLSGGASVSVGSMTITADEIELEGDNWQSVTCTGKVHISDSERGLDIETSRLFYDRQAERLVISAWCFITDSANKLAASASSLFYDMDSEMLEMQMDVRLVKDTDDGILSASAQSVTYDRAASLLTLSAGAEVDWKGDSYHATLITIDLDEETVSLSGQIGGSIHG